MVPYTLLLSVVEYKTLVLRGDLETAAEVLETIPKASWQQGRAGARAGQAGGLGGVQAGAMCTAAWDAERWCYPDPDDPTLA